MHGNEAVGRGNGDRDRCSGDDSLRPAEERFIIARAAGKEFAVPAYAVAAVDIATEDRWADLGGGARGVLWEGRYLFVENLPGGAQAPRPGPGEMPILVLRGEHGLKALIIERLLGEIIGARRTAEAPWAGRVESQGHDYLVLEVSVPAAEPAPVAAPEPVPEAAAAAEPEPEPRPAAAPEPRPGAAQPQPEPSPPPGSEPVPASPEPSPLPEPEPVPAPVAGSKQPPVQKAPSAAESPGVEPARPSAPVSGDGRAHRFPKWRRRAVVVEPRVALRRALARRLRERGFEVREATRPAEFRGAAGIAFIGDLQMGLSPEIVAEMLAASGWRPVLVSTDRRELLGPFTAALVWPVRDEDLDRLLASMGGDEDAGGKSGRNPGGGAGTA